MHYKSVDKFTFVASSEQNAELSYKQIAKLCESDFFEKKGIEQPEVIQPLVFCEEKEWIYNMGSDEQFDLIVSNMTMHWYNDI